MPAARTRSAEADAMFFTSLENGHSVRAACATALYASRCVYRWRSQDPEFAARWALARQMAGDLLEEEADRRGRDGCDVPVFYRGQQCGTKRRFADGLLLARLKAVKPEQYREHRCLPSDPQKQNVTVMLRDFTLENVVRRLARGEKVDAAALPPRIQCLLAQSDNDAGPPDSLLTPVPHVPLQPESGLWKNHAQKEPAARESVSKPRSYPAVSPAKSL
jgi:hypothetical protein